MTPTEINQKLADNYGLDLDGTPKFRIAWTTDLTEKRKKRVLASGEEVIEVHEVPKYAYAPDRWVLEIYTPTANDELTTKTGYEPIWVFQDKNGAYLPVVWAAVEIIIQALLNRYIPPPRSHALDVYEEEQEFQASKKRDLEYLNAVSVSDETEKVRAGLAMYNPHDSAKQEKSDE